MECYWLCVSAPDDRLKVQSPVPQNAALVANSPCRYHDEVESELGGPLTEHDWPPHQKKHTWKNQPCDNGAED